MWTHSQFINKLQMSEREISIRRKRIRKWTVRALRLIGWILICTFLINLEPMLKTKQNQWTECALAIGVSAVSQKRMMCACL